VWGSRLRRTAVALAVLAGSQLGHAIVYYARFGAAAGGRQAAGVHGYFPALTGGLSAAIGGLAMVCLLVLAAARATRTGPAIYRSRATVRFLDALPALFATQLLVFVGQEVIEGLASSPAHLPSLVELLVWGAFGQLPAAAVAAALLTWLLMRVDAAWSALVDGTARLLHEHFTPAFERPLRPEPALALRLASAFPSALRKRGPPLCSNP
jgi:hypothetical protein